MTGVASTPILLDSAFDALPDGVAVVDQLGNIVFLNAQFSSMLNCDFDAVNGIPFPKLTSKVGFDISDLVDRVETGRKAETLLNFGEGRFILASIRRLGRDS